MKLQISDEYFETLIKQYKAARGIKSKIDCASDELIDDMIEWMLDRIKQGREYVSFLNYLDFEFAYSNCAEIGKGEFDSVVKQFDTTIITPYEEVIENVDKERIMVAKFELCEDNKPYIFKGAKKIAVPPYAISKLMTQNNDNISRWEELHNSGEYEIIVGAYGSVDDKDFKTKIDNLEKFRDRLYDVNDVKYETAISEQSYFSVVATQPKRKEYVKCR